MLRVTGLCLVLFTVVFGACDEKDPVPFDFDNVPLPGGEASDPSGDESADPSDPVVDPSEPADPSDPVVDPSDPVVDPSEPADPSDPVVDPSEPADPSDPIDPADPIDPDPVEESPPGTAARDNARVFFVGHSLINFDMPAMLNSVAQNAGVSHTYAQQIINGAPLKYNWEHSSQGQGIDSRIALPTGNYDTLVITEAIPLDNHITWSQTDIFGGYFHALILQANAGAQTYMYETWHARSTADWRNRIETDLAKWESEVDQINAAHDGPDMRIIPGGQALGDLVDAIGAGTVPGVNSVDQLFDDDIHLSDLGNYFIACVQFATIYRRSPVGLTGQTATQFGVAFPAVSSPTAARLQEIAWQAVLAYPRSGVVAP